SVEHLKYKWGGLISLSWKMALSQTDILTGISNFLLNMAKDKGFSGHSVLIPNGVDVPLFTKEIDEETRKKVKLNLGKRDGDIFLVTTSRLSYKNGLDDVIFALKDLPENFHFIVIGKGEEGNNLQKLADKLSIKTRVKFLGFVNYKDIPDYLSVCDIFIRPSRSEGFGNSFIEAMARGLPVIATPVGGIVDFLSDGETGVFCSPDNPRSIIKAVETLRDVSFKEKIVNNAKKMVIEKYSWDKIAVDMKEKVFELFRAV
ncbi:MAG TPA: glycosyltransferase family 4 protein, partial [Candidatus Paceibacterota bacterium]